MPFTIPFHKGNGACKWRSATKEEPSLAAAMAASLMSPTRSAPEKPMVRFAHAIQSGLDVSGPADSDTIEVES